MLINQLQKQQVNNVVFFEEGVRLADGGKSNYVEIIRIKEETKETDKNKRRLAYKMNVEGQKIVKGKNTIANNNGNVRKALNEKGQAFRKRNKKLYVPKSRNLKKHLNKKIKRIKHIVQFFLCVNNFQFA